MESNYILDQQNNGIYKLVSTQNIINFEMHYTRYCTCACTDYYLSHDLKLKCWFSIINGPNTNNSIFWWCCEELTVQNSNVCDLSNIIKKLRIKIFQRLKCIIDVGEIVMNIPLTCVRVQVEYLFVHSNLCTTVYHLWYRQHPATYIHKIWKNRNKDDFEIRWNMWRSPCLVKGTLPYLRCHQKPHKTKLHLTLTHHQGLIPPMETFLVSRH